MLSLFLFFSFMHIFLLCFCVFVFQKKVVWVYKVCGWTTTKQSWMLWLLCVACDWTYRFIWYPSILCVFECLDHTCAFVSPTLFFPSRFFLRYFAIHTRATPNQKKTHLKKRFGVVEPLSSETPKKNFLFAWSLTNDLNSFVFVPLIVYRIYKNMQVLIIIFMCCFIFVSLFFFFIPFLTLKKQQMLIFPNNIEKVQRGRK